MKLTGDEIRKTFLKFFEERAHRIVRSSSLVPTNDPTLLFTNAGMNQFKDVFLGLEQRDYNRATTCQKCVRAGGKHNDLENVGFTNRHHTFFEMLGNFSFGDYFKKDAIAFAWELITSPNWFAIPVDKLYFTVFGGAEIQGQKLQSDQEALTLWKNIGAPKERILEIPGLKENFWAMGDTGPCGPCSELHYDMGPTASDAGHTDCKFPCDCGRYVEIWNLVFMQFNRQQEEVMGSANEEGVKHKRTWLEPLPRPSVDTGMGLERLAAVLQGKISNFDTDLFQPLIKIAANKGRVNLSHTKAQPSLRIIADHARAATFLISDGLIPSNEGRGYVLRKIIRRALYHVKLLNIPTHYHLFPEMAFGVRDLMQEAYPELAGSAGRVSQILTSEEARFDRIMSTGLEKFEELVNSSLDAESVHDSIAPAPRSTTGCVSGADAFKLHDTFGFRRDFIEDIAHDRGIKVGWPEFEVEMVKQRERAKASWKGAHKAAANPVYAKLGDTFHTEPDFYFGTSTTDCRIEAIVTKEGPANEIKAGTEAEIVLDRTSIYSESGGQVADIGAFYDNTGSLEVAEVRGAYYPVTRLVAHRILAKEDLHVGDRVSTIADPQRRARNMRNHTATHLMHAALRNILGSHVKQAGSLVAPDHLRFDFSHFAAVDESELTEIEQQVNEEILRNLEVTTDITNIDDALASGALAFFGDKYPEANVRVVTIPEATAPRGFYSKELCGGTHTRRTGEIGIFKIISEQSTSAGVRRIEAISGDTALAEYQSTLKTLRTAASLLNVSEDQVIGAIQRQADEIKRLEAQLKVQVRRSSLSQVDGLLTDVREVKGVKIVAAKIENADRDALRQMVDTLRQKLGSGVVVLFSAADGKVSLIAGVTKDLIPRLHAGKIVQELAKLVGGSGGGRPDLAEAGGKDTSAIESTLRTVYPLLERSL
jgi:alanyl-tRNA synthetase